MVCIQLQDTLADFFRSEERFKDSKIIFLAYNPISDVESTPNIGPSIRYRIQQWRPASEDDFTSLVNLVLMPQRIAWMAGDMEVVFLKVNEQLATDQAASRDGIAEDLQTTLQSLEASQRFRPVFCASWPDVQHVIGSAHVLPFLPCDGLNDMPQVTNPDTYYILLSKRQLAISGLPTPKAQILDIDVPSSGWTDASLRAAINHVSDAIRGRELPFVLKCNSSGGSKGVYLISTVEQQAEATASIEEHLFIELPQSTVQDDLHPLSLILTDMLFSPVVSLNFFVTGHGQSRFSSCVQPQLSETGHWLGASICYSDQRSASIEYAQILGDVARFLHANGYIGPANIDVMLDQQRRQMVIDLNPRPSGSFMLGCLTPHFAKTLHCNFAQVLPTLKLGTTRQTFSERFADQLQSGHIIVLAWYSSAQEQTSQVGIAIGGSTRETMDQLRVEIESWMSDL